MAECDIPGKTEMASVHRCIVVAAFALLLPHRLFFSFLLVVVNASEVLAGCWLYFLTSIKYMSINVQKKPKQSIGLLLSIGNKYELR